MLSPTLASTPTRNFCVFSACRNTCQVSSNGEGCLISRFCAREPHPPNKRLFIPTGRSKGTAFRRQRLCSKLGDSQVSTLSREVGGDVDIAEGEASSSSSWFEGNLYLLSVAVLWGSYTPVLKILFNLPGGPTPELVAWIRGVLQLAILAVVVLISQQRHKASGKKLPRRHQTEMLGRKVPTILLGALEIGFYNSCATLLQTEGIASSGAIRASFLIQATALWTPVLSTLFGDRPSNWQWAGSILALCSACIVTLDQQQSIEVAGFPETGDLFILAATVVYSMATVRIPTYAKNVPPLELAAGKSSALAVVASILLVFEFSSLDPEPMQNLVDLWPSYQEQVSAWGGLLWAGVFCGALTAFLHVKGQSMVTATEAQLVFSTVPLWSALIAAATLPNEHLGPLTCLGAGLMVVAGVVSTKK
jgi:drug/metabolite transporter (DMT)-like permease